MLTIPIFDGFSRTYKIKGARAQVERNEADLAETEHRILMEVVKAYADASAAFTNLRASDDLLKAALSALALSQRKYDKNASDILEVLNSQSALADARQERIRCLADWRSGRLRLLANVGLMDRRAAAN